MGDRDDDRTELELDGADEGDLRCSDGESRERVLLEWDADATRVSGAQGSWDW